MTGGPTRTCRRQTVRGSATEKVQEFSLPQAPVAHPFHRVLGTPAERLLAEIDKPLRLSKAADLIALASTVEPLDLPGGTN